MKKIAIVIGDNLHNTFGVVRSLGRKNVDFYLLCASNIAGCNIAKSRYVKAGRYRRYATDFELQNILDELKNIDGYKYLICTSDPAAEWVDANEDYLNQYFITPCRGKKIGKLFNKKSQCELAEECGLVVPKSFVHNVDDNLEYDKLSYPLFTKPLVSVDGHKQDIHICKTAADLKEVIENAVTTKSFIIQEYVEKDYEIDCLGVRTDKECIIAGVVKKIRVYPDNFGAGAYGVFCKAESFNIDKTGIERFLAKSGYYGPFSVEFMHKNGVNYFLEVNFRNDGLAYVATCGGFNLYESYINNKSVSFDQFKSIRMMNVNFDFQFMKNTKKISFMKWIYQFMTAECHLDFCLLDPMPLFWRPIAFALRRLPLNTSKLLK